MAIHKKILELKKKVGNDPIHFFVASQRSMAKIPLETRSIKPPDPDSRLIKQYFCIFGVHDDLGMVPEKGIFKRSIDQMGPGSESNYKIVVLNQHQQKDPLCLPKVLEETETGLYGEYEPDPMDSGDRLLMQVRKGTINNGSYGFNYVWDKMEYNHKTDKIHAYDCDLFEVSPVTIGSQRQTFAIRALGGKVVDENLDQDTEDLITQVPPALQLELRSLITRHNAVAATRGIDFNNKVKVSTRKSININSLIKNINDEIKAL